MKNICHLQPNRHNLLIGKQLHRCRYPLQMVADNSICNTLCGDRKRSLKSKITNLYIKAVHHHDYILKLRFYTWKLQYPCAETVVSLRGNYSFPPGNGSSDVGNEDFNCRKINLDACTILLTLLILRCR